MSISQCNVTEMTMRKIDSILLSRATIEGAGVHLKRAFGPTEVPLLDPFLMLDDFHSENPEDYMAGFPWHPHRGIETVTYMIRGAVEHGDSIGNKGVINSGDVQWMTAGSGIMHQEMPKEYHGTMQGFQLWVNLPASHKMMKPRYRGITEKQMPNFSPRKGVHVKVIAGQVDGTKGPVRDLVVDSEYLDVTLGPSNEIVHPIEKGKKAFAYVFEGGGSFHQESKKLVGAESLVIFEDGDEVMIRSGKEGIRFLLVSGNPIGEPVAWGGPIVMNTEEELDVAFDQLRKGTFIKV